MDGKGPSGKLMKRALSIALFAGVVLASLPALAQHRPGGGRAVAPRQGGQAAPQAPRGQPQQPARMSEAERQQLRRDISDHGRDIYRDQHGGARKQGGNAP